MTAGVSLLTEAGGEGAMQELECYDIRVWLAMSVLYFELRKGQCWAKRLRMVWELSDCMPGVVEKLATNLGMDAGSWCN